MLEGHFLRNLPLSIVGKDIEFSTVVRGPLLGFMLGFMLAHKHAFHARRWTPLFHNDRPRWGLDELLKGLRRLTCPSGSTSRTQPNSLQVPQNHALRPFRHLSSGALCQADKTPESLALTSRA